MQILVVGPGCPRCEATERNVREACAQLNLAAEVSHIYDPREMARLGARLSPAVLVDGRVVVQGKIPDVEELKQLLAS